MIRSLALAGALALAACETPGGVDATPDDGADAPVGAVTTAADLVGLSETAVRGALGAPDRRRPEGEVAIWRYDSETCVVELFFYPDDGGQAVRFAEARDRLGAPADEAACFDDLRARGSLTS